MATREEKLKIIEKLKNEIEYLRNEIERKKEMQKRRFIAGSLMRTGIVLMLLAVGICIGGYFL